MRRNMTFLGALVGIGLTLVGCSAPEGPTTLDIPAGQYGLTFDAARRVLRDARFDLERVDAREGVISTQPKASAGLFSLWDEEQSTAAQEFEDAAHNHRRVVRVTFEPVAQDELEAPSTPPLPAPATDGAEVVDLRTNEAPTRMNVRVIVLRDYMPGWQVQTSSIRLSTHAFDPELWRRGMLPDYETAVDENRALAARIVKRIDAESGKARTSVE